MDDVPPGRFVSGLLYSEAFVEFVPLIKSKFASCIRYGALIAEVLEDPVFEMIRGNRKEYIPGLPPSGERIYLVLEGWLWGTNSNSLLRSGLFVKV